MSTSPLIEIRDLRTWFPIRKGLLQRTVAHVRAVDNVALTIPRGRTLALVGESGCGKTTLGKTIVGLLKPRSGEILFDGTDLCPLSPGELHAFRKRIQIVFQDPAHSMNPRMQILDLVAEGIRSFGLASTRSELIARVTEALERVGLGSDALYRYPHEFSGGQRQRLCIARALTVDPEFIVCDEPTSALDVSVQASILNLLRQLQQDLGLTYLFITHDLSVVEHVADRVAVMYLGEIVEEAETAVLFRSPKHPYTEALMQSAPSLDPEDRELKTLGGEVPSPVTPPPGCRFHTRCPKRMEKCDREAVPFFDVDGVRCRCFLYET